MTTKNRFQSFAFVIAFAVVSVSTTLSNVTNARAEALAPAVIAFIDYQKILRDAVAAKSIRQQIQAFRNNFQSELATSEQALRNEEQELKRQRALLSAEVFDAKRRAFEDNVARAQRTVQDRNRMLDRSYTQAMNQVSVMVRKIVADMSGALGFNYVVERSQIMFAKRDFNITAQVLEQLNAKLPTVQVSPPSPKAK
ncbi:MAG: OmpH family outer membrane protein [Alphaproteobacteria bacterium]|jgi:outer membrane protein|nr:OmpH family outer membrane protein [Alphaproteobacteria bacterium]MBT7747107.1 OmpH family outer membrane protein [Alphaproteobacteria bacterium]